MIAVALTVTAAVLLLVPPHPRLPLVGRPRPPRRLHGRSPLILAALALPLLATTAAVSPRTVLLAALAAALATGALRLLAARRHDRAATDLRRRVIDLCDVLRAELAAGQTPAAALDHAAAEWPPIAPAARAAATGGDVPTTLRTLATTPGADALRIVAAAWHVSHRTGHGLADVLTRTATDLRAAEHTRRIVAGELASARATARLLAALPFLTLLIASGAGGSGSRSGSGPGPWRFLLTQPAGLACLTAGLAFGYAGLTWIEALARDVDRLS